MSYENAPATKMLATHCVVCRRPLLDAASVELGIGPECRNRSGVRAAQVSEEAHQRANQITHAISLGVPFQELRAMLVELNMLGFQQLASLISDRGASIKVTYDGGNLIVDSPFTEGSLATIRAIPGRRPVYEEVRVRTPTGLKTVKKFKGNSFPLKYKNMVWRMLKRHFPGAMGVGPNGPFQVPDAQEENTDAQEAEVDASPASAP